MRSNRLVAILVSGALSAITATSAYAQAAKPSVPDNQPEPMIMLVPVEISMPALKSGCWVQLYDQRNFKGDVFTIAGPVQLDSTSKSAGRHLKSTVDSLVTGPKTTLTVYEHSMFKDKAVKFEPNSREPGLIKKLGATGRIQSLKLECSS